MYKKTSYLRILIQFKIFTAKMHIILLALICMDNEAEIWINVHYFAWIYQLPKSINCHCQLFFAHKYSVKTVWCYTKVCQLHTPINKVFLLLFSRANAISALELGLLNIPMAGFNRVTIAKAWYLSKISRLPKKSTVLSKNTMGLRAKVLFKTLALKPPYFATPYISRKLYKICNGGENIYRISVYLTFLIARRK